MNDFYEAHYDSCDYCLEVSESNRPEAEKDKLIYDHTINAMAEAGDRLHDEYKDMNTY